MNSNNGTTEVSARSAMIVASVLAAILGFAVGDGVTTLFCVLGAALVAGGAAGQDGDTAQSRVARATGISTGAFIAVGGILAFPPANPSIVLPLGLAFLVINLDATTEFTWAGTGEIDRTLRATLAVLVVVGLIAAARHAGLFMASAVIVGAGWTAFVSKSLLWSFIALQVELLVAVKLFDLAIPRLKGWLSEEEWGQLAGLERYQTNPRQIRWQYWGMIGLELFLAQYPWMNDAFADTIAMLSLLGRVIETLLGIWGHGLLALAILVPLLVLVGAVVRNRIAVVVVTLSPNAVASVAGGFVAVAVALFVVGIPQVGTAVAEGWLGVVVSVVGSGAVVLGGLFLALLGLWITLAAALYLEESRIVPDRTGGFAIGSSLLFIVAVVAGLRSATAPIVFLGVAGAIVVWDLGEYATDLGTVVPAETRTARAEVVHVASSVLVGLIAVVLATAIAYLVVPFAPVLGTPVPDWQASLALLLALVALGAFALSIQGDSSVAGDSADD